MYIKADDVCVTFPVFDAHQRSFKKTVFKAAAGGGLSSFRKGFAEIEALKHITLDIREGERVALRQNDAVARLRRGLCADARHDCGQWQRHQPLGCNARHGWRGDRF